MLELLRKKISVPSKLLSIPYWFYAAVIYYFGILSLIQHGFRAATQPDKSFPLETFEDYLFLSGKLILIAIFAVVALGIWKDKKWGLRGGLIVNIVLSVFGLILLYGSITCEGLGCLFAGFILVFVLPVVFCLLILTTSSLLSNLKEAKYNDFSKFVFIGVGLFVALHLLVVGFLQFQFEAREREFFELFHPDDIQ